MGIVVVGAGLAGARAAACLREVGYGGHITVLGAEGTAPYDRPPLSKYLFTRTTPVWLRDDLGIDIQALADSVHLDEPATSLQLDPLAITTATTAIATEAVVIATGSRPLVPQTLAGALTLHSLADAQILRERIRPGVRLACVGAGWIGCEVASVASAAGAKVTVIEAGTGPLHASLPPRIGDKIATWFANSQVELLAGSPVAHLEQNAGNWAIHLADGTAVSADIVIAAVGVRPNTEWLAATGLRDKHGYLPVDSQQQVCPQVMAVGDVSIRSSPRFGQVPGGHWDLALRSPEIAARAIVGAPIPPGIADPVPYVFSTMFGHDLALLGVPRPEHTFIPRGAGSGLWLDGNRLAAVLLSDQPRQIGSARRLFSGTELPLVNLEAAADPDVPLARIGR